MKIALIYPPTCDPAAPYLSVPSLTGYLRSHNVEVLPVDANIEYYDSVLRKIPLTKLANRLEKRLAGFEKKKRLTHVEQLAYSALWQARGAAHDVPGAVEAAVSTLRDRSGERFFNPVQYESAIITVESALQLISAVYTPLSMDFTGYHTPFSLLTLSEIEADASPERNPFYDYFADDLARRLKREHIDVAGISVVFPGQIQPAYSLAIILRKQIPGIYIAAGGPAVTQIMARLDEEKQIQASAPFDSVILFEGEEALLDLINTLKKGNKPPEIINGNSLTDMASLPAPDFEGLPMEKYLSPATVLPYDPTRGCYWGKCAFCHYGLTDRGTARYRERPVETVSDHIRRLTQQHRCRFIYLSQDTMSPDFALRLSQSFQSSGISCKWSSDMRPEPSLTPECCKSLADGGALSLSLGIESGSPRILSLIHKGVSVKNVKAVIHNLADAGIGVEAMCFTDFPTETYGEALATINLIREMRGQISLFICGSFALCHGSRIAQNPEKYGIQDVWQVEGDELGTGLFYAMNSPAKSRREQGKVDKAVEELSGLWRLHNYPWAGSLSTAHTLLWYDKYGADVFRRFAGVRSGLKMRELTALSKFDVARVFEQSQEHEAEIWDIMINKERKVTRSLYRSLADEFPAEPARPGYWRYGIGKFPEPA